MSFGDKRTHERRVKEGTVHAALWLNGTGTTESAKIGAEPFSSLQGGQTLRSWTERKTAWGREELKGRRRSVTDGAVITVTVELMFTSDF